MRRTVLFILAMIILLPGLLSGATTIDNQDNLQQAIDNAQSGDTLLLAPGTYTADPVEFMDSLCGNCAEHQTPHWASYGFQIKGKSLWIIGSGDETILETRAGYGVFVDNCPDAVIMNLTITGGIRDTSGMATDAGVVARNSRVTVQNCWIRDNTDYPDSIIVGIGGVMGREGAELFILNNRMTNNTWDGVALYRGATAYIADNVIHEGRGAGIGITWDATATVVRNQISNYWKGIGSFGATRVVCHNNIVYHCLGWGIIATGTSYMDCANNLIYRNGNCGFGLWGKETEGRMTNNVIMLNGWRDEWVCPQVGVWNYGHPLQFPMSYNLLSGNVAGDWRDMPDYTDEFGNVAVDPMWDTLTFAPLPDSPLINSGNPEFTDPDGSPSDIGIYGGPNAFREPIEVRRDPPQNPPKKRK
ncbi:MAG: hypothetical protein GF341_06185 [candidate division Zixibacteria bacterium]|nr:hypothetical protein [candidate division Zixibacteria bacterium]